MISPLISYLRSAVACIRKWTTHIDPTLNISPFTAEEDNILLQAVADHGTGNWALISRLLPGRSNLNVRDRWKAISAGNSTYFQKEPSALAMISEESVFGINCRYQ